MSSSNYLFVNKGVDSGSLSHSEKSERVKIHSHVQLGQIYGRKNNLREQQVRYPHVQAFCCELTVN